MQRPAGRQVLVGVGREEAARIELIRGVEKVVVGCRPVAEARDIHCVDIVTRIAVDDPVGDGKADCCTLGVSGHHARSGPVARQPANGTDEGVAVRGDGKCSVDPSLAPRGLEGGEPSESDLQLGGDPVDVGWQQLDAEVPGSTLRMPVGWV
ncbi:unannotated protein [freshwater metagenome]|uniref:Unannotated protein n=1 Tax=freshwater metagenome TaxID=449393 RepID=A0A6J6TVB1_9ZZZZ